MTELAQLQASALSLASADDALAVLDRLKAIESRVRDAKRDMRA